jgi:Phosducin
VYPISKPDYAKDVTEASSKFPVLVNLTSGMGTNVESRILTELWRELARKYADIKFCEIRGDLCIEGYPERNCPTVLVYKDGDIRRQVVTLRELQGVRTSLRDLEMFLVDVGVIEEKDIRLREENEEEGRETNGRRGLQGKKAAMEEDDDDWD